MSEKQRFEVDISASSKGLQEALEDTERVVEETTRTVDEANTEMGKGGKALAPAKSATERIRDGWRTIRQTARDAGGGFRGVSAAVRQCWNYAKNLGSETRNAGQAGDELGKAVGQLQGKLVGAAAVMKAAQIAWQNIVALVKEYVKQLQEAEKARAFGNLAEGAEDMTRVREKSDKERETLAKKLQEFAGLVDEEKKTNSATARMKRMAAQDELRKMYGFEFEEVGGKVRNMDEQISKMLEKLAQKRIESISAQLKANERVRDGANSFIDSFGGIGGYFKKVGYNLFSNDRNGENAIKEAREAANKASAQNLELLEERRKLEREGMAAEYRAQRIAKKSDETAEAKRKAEDEAAKKLEEQRKRLETANKNLSDWADSLGDEHERNIKQIRAKYEELLREGVGELEARSVMDEALRQENEREEKKRRELADALQNRIEQYKAAYKAYQDAQNEIRDAQRAYAKAVRDNADESKKDALQKRRDRLQERMARFGFSVYEGFRLNEGVASRRRRMRTAQLDAGISEKMTQSEKGERVRWTSEERRRIRELQALQKRDKALEATQKQMDAANKQEQAADALKNAADAVQKAVSGRNEAGKGVLSARSKVLEARGSLSARGVRGGAMPKGQREMFAMLHRDLQQLNQRVYIVK